MRGYIECISDEMLKLSTGRYAKLGIAVPYQEGESFPRFHIGECEILQDGEIQHE